MHAIYYRTAADIQAVCGFIQIYNILCDSFRICLQKVYKKSIELARRRWYNTTRTKREEAKNIRDLEHELAAIREVLAMIANALFEIAEAIKNK